MAWDEAQHPREPAGDEHGGEFASKHGARPAPSTLKDRIAALEAEMERVNDMSMDLESEDDPRAKALKVRYAGLMAIQTILENQSKADRNASLRESAAFFYRMDNSAPAGIAGAVQASVEGDAMHLHWAGSVRKGVGRQLIGQAIDWAKSKGATRMQGDAQWGSLPYYERHFRARATGKYNPLGDNTPFEANLQ